MSVCEVLKEEPCGATACDPVFSGAGYRRLVRREGDIPKTNCWTDELTAWLQSTNRGTFANAADADAVPILVEFFAAHPNLRSDMLFGVGEGGALRPLAARLHFESTFVQPQPQADTQAVVDEWDAAVARVQRAAPADFGVQMYSTGRWELACPTRLSFLWRPCGLHALADQMLHDIMAVTGIRAPTLGGLVLRPRNGFGALQCRSDSRQY